MAIPLFSKWNQRRKISTLQKKLRKAKKNVCDISDEVESAKQDAGRIFTKKEYDSRIGPLEIDLNTTCKCSRAAEEAPPGEGELKKPRECRDMINAELKRRLPSTLTPKQREEILVGGQEKTRSQEENKAVADCQQGIDIDYEDFIEKAIKPKAKQKGIALSGRRRKGRR